MVLAIKLSTLCNVLYQIFHSLKNILRGSFWGKLLWGAFWRKLYLMGLLKTIIWRRKFLDKLLDKDKVSEEILLKITSKGISHRKPLGDFPSGESFVGNLSELKWDRKQRAMLKNDSRHVKVFYSASSSSFFNNSTLIFLGNWSSFTITSCLEEKQLLISHLQQRTLDLDYDHMEHSILMTRIVLEAAMGSWLVHKTQFWKLFSLSFFCQKYFWNVLS